MELSKYLRDYSRTIAGKEQLLIAAYARALEVIPRQLCENAGFDATNILNKLRQKHSAGDGESLRICNVDRGSSVQAPLYFSVFDTAHVKSDVYTA